MEACVGKEVRSTFAKPNDSVFRKEENIIYKLCRWYGINEFKFASSGR
jgi:hypothetical protein